MTKAIFRGKSVNLSVFIIKQNEENEETVSGVSIESLYRVRPGQETFHLTLRALMRWLLGFVLHGTVEVGTIFCYYLLETFRNRIRHIHWDICFQELLHLFLDSVPQIWVNACYIQDTRTTIENRHSLTSKIQLCVEAIDGGEGLMR